MRWSISLLALLSCSGARASIEVEDARASFVNLGVNRHIYVDTDVLAHDQLGGKIGQYCTTISIPLMVDKTECADDLADGDRKTVRIESDIDVPDSVGIGIRVRHFDNNIGRGLVGPVTPR
jgi:hypothetical protein